MSGMVYLSDLLLRICQRGGNAQADVDQAGKISSPLFEVFASFQFSRYGAGQQGIHAVGYDRQADEQRSQHQRLSGGAASVLVNELWQKGEKEKSSFRVQDVDGKPLPVDAPEAFAL